MSSFSFREILSLQSFSLFHLLHQHQLNTSVSNVGGRCVTVRLINFSCEANAGRFRFISIVMITLFYDYFSFQHMNISSEYSSAWKSKRTKAIWLVSSGADGSITRAAFITSCAVQPARGNKNWTGKTIGESQLTANPVSTEGESAQNSFIFHPQHERWVSWQNENKIIVATTPGSDSSPHH